MVHSESQASPKGNRMETSRTNSKRLCETGKPHQWHRIVLVFFILKLF